MATNPKPTNVERALVEAPLTAEEEEIERETENLQIDVSVEEEDGGVEIDLSEEEENSEDYKRYNQLMKEKLKKTKENMIKYSSLINQ